MHESSLGRQILEVVLDRTRTAGAARVSAVRGWVAETEHLDPGAIAFHFRAHARGTAAEEARLDLELRHVEARCRDCGEVYLPEHHLLLCPRCGGGEAEVLGETGIGVESIDVEG